ncbi:MAG: helix-turn-helix transcriptional regulator [Actinomycetota bacterium]|nr:helix-turn-helix transcriptional regulator [Actinomycetota bacterium]
MSPAGTRGTEWSLNEAIAEGVRELRASRGWTQDRLADRLRAAGFLGWTRAMVGALETRRRQVSAGDLVALSVAFGVHPQDLLPARSGPVVLDDGTAVPLEAVRLALGGKPRAAERTIGPIPPVETGAGTLRAGLPAVKVPRALVERAAKGELELHIARSLGLDPREVAATAFALYGRSATGERERRAPDPRRPGVKRQASRRIIGEIRSAVGARARRRAD